MGFFFGEDNSATVPGLAIIFAILIGLFVAAAYYGNININPVDGWEYVRFFEYHNSTNGEFFVGSTVFPVLYRGAFSVCHPDLDKSKIELIKKTVSTRDYYYYTKLKQTTFSENSFFFDGCSHGEMQIVDINVDNNYPFYVLRKLYAEGGA
jgi:hypothetical protein